VKASDWTELCERERDNGGEVVAVSLTAQSMREMVNDVLTSGGATTYIYGPDGELNEGTPGEHVVAGARLGSLTNKVTGREVEFTPLAEEDTATVRDADGNTRVIAFAAA
jgi:hypothetical protein